MKKTNKCQLNFSELESGQKQKYFDFLLKNNIGFEQGENNNFVATIKIKNKDSLKANIENLENKSTIKKKKISTGKESKSNFFKFFLKVF